MKNTFLSILLLLGLLLPSLLSAVPPLDDPRFGAQAPKSKTKRYLYVATPGIRNYLEYGGHGLLVYDMDNNYTFVKRIPTAGLNDKGEPINVKGIAMSLAPTASTSAPSAACSAWT